jgi:hypothetical protein
MFLEIMFKVRSKVNSFKGVRDFPVSSFLVGF